MIYKALLVLLILDAFVLIAAILLQSGKGGGLSAGFGGSGTSDAVFGTRQAGNLLTTASWWCGGIFIGLAFILEVSAARGRTPTSVLDKSFTAPKAAAPARPAQPVPGTQPSAVPGAAAPASAVPTTPSTSLPNAADTKAPATPAPTKKP